MSSPGARQRRRRQQYQSPRTRREIAAAVLVGVGIVAATALLIWMLRPGGIADRQPRSSWVFGGAFLAIALACYLILRPSSRVRFDRRIALAGSVGVILLVTLVAAIAWPHGLLRHTPKLPPFATTPTAPPAAGGTTTGAPTGGSSTTGQPGATTASGATTTPSTAAPGATTQPTQPTQPTQTTIP
jgi:multisubunit Na+/H+ antiporter MnhB subunit